MHFRYLTLALVALAAIGPAPGPAADPSGTEAERIARLVAHLGSPKYAVRQAAARSLEALGEPALAALAKAVRSDDPEVRHRSVELIRTIETRAETAKILSPTRVRLVCKDTPVGQALEDLRKRTGYAIQLGGNQQRVAARRVTLDTGETTFWEALDQLCQKAGLVEADLVPAAPATWESGSQTDQLRKLIEVQQLQARQLQIQVQQLQRLRLAGIEGSFQPLQPVDYNRLVLVEAKSPVVATCYLGSVRIQVVRRGAEAAGGLENPYGPRARVPAVGPRAGLTPALLNPSETLALVVRPEPKVQWHRLLNLRITQATDAANRPLKEASVLEDFQNSRSPYELELKGLVSTAYVGPSAQPMPGVPVRLRPADPSAKLVKEVRGRVEAEVQGPPKPLLTVENVLQAAGQLVKDDQGNSLKVLQVARQANGVVKLQVEMVHPFSENVILLRQAARVRRLGAVGVQDLAMSVGNPGSLELRDARGRAFELVQPVVPRRVNFNGAVMSRELEFSFRPRPDQGPADKLILPGSRPTVIAVPFTLTNVKLP